MSFANWSESYSMRVQQIDTEHQKLFAIIDDLYEGMKAGRGKDVLHSELSQIVGYTQQHFSHEENLMRQAGYAGLDDHIVVHRGFVDRLKQFSSDFNAGSAGLSIALLDFMKEWLTRHIMGTNQQYSAALNAHGIH